MTNVSSNWTLFLKWYLPTFWIVFFGTILFALLTLDEAIYMVVQFTGANETIARILLITLYLLGVGILYYTCMRLKRVEFSPDGVLVTNYLKIYKYPYANIERIVPRRRFLGFRPMTLHFTVPSSFGKSVVFLASTNYDKFLAAHPLIAAQIR